MNGFKSYEDNGWVHFQTDEGEEASFNRSNVAMVKVLPGHKDTRLIIETLGSTKIQIHYMKDLEECLNIQRLITGKNR